MSHGLVLNFGMSVEMVQPPLPPNSTLHIRYLERGEWSSWIDSHLKSIRALRDELRLCDTMGEFHQLLETWEK